MPSTSQSVLRASLAIACLAAHLSAQGPPARSEFIIKKGKDTVAVEIFSRDAKTLTSEIHQFNGPTTQYTLNLKPDSAVQHVELMRQNRHGGALTLIVQVGDTLVNATIAGGGDNGTFDFPIHGRATPFLAVSFALSEQIVFASHLAVGKSASWTAVRLGVADTAALTVTRFHADSVLLSMPDVKLKLVLAPDGRVIGGVHLSQDWIVERKALR